MFVAGSLLLTACWIGAGDAKDEKKDKKPAFTVGKDTTYVLGPKYKSGHIDYFTALNERMSKGVTPKNNANVLLMRAFGPKPEGARMPAEYYKWLKIDEPAEKGNYLVDFEKYLTDTLKRDGAFSDKFYEESERVTKRPWTKKEFPDHAKWLEAMEKPLALAVEATKRPRYFNPLVTSNPGKSGLVGALLPTLQKSRTVGRALSMRAMLHVGEGKHKEAWEDLQACHRLARLVGNGATLIEGLVGVALDMIAFDGDLAFLEGTKLDAAGLRKVLRDLQALPPIPATADKIDLGERFMFLDGVMMVDRYGPEYLDQMAGGKKPSGKPDLLTKVAFADLEWDGALRKANHFYDRMVAAMREKDYQARTRKLDEMEQELKKLKPKSMITFLFGGKSGKVRGEMLGDLMLALLVPAVRKVAEAEIRATQIQRNVEVAFALEAYRRDAGQYPKTLNALAPKYLNTVPGDIFSGKALNYRPMAEGYLLYSVGANRKDEAGRWYDDDPPGDDPRVRMPSPKTGR